LNTLTENAADVLQNNLEAPFNRYTGAKLLQAAKRELSPAGLRKAAESLKATASLQQEAKAREALLEQAASELETVAGNAALYSRWTRLYGKLCAAA
jgi:hypothetical protein